jgi:hypothetical protein
MTYFLKPVLERWRKKQREAAMRMSATAAKIFTVIERPFQVSV